MAKKSSQWLGAFRDFLSDLKIHSKEFSSTQAGGISFDLWQSQELYLETLAYGIDNDIHRFYYLKARQLGVTTVSLAVDLFWLGVHPGLVGALVVDTEKNAEKNRQQIHDYVKSLPDGYWGDDYAQYKGERSFIAKSNSDFILFANGSRLDLKVAGTKNKGIAWAEGEGYAFAHLTEISKYGDGEALKSFEDSFAKTNPDRLYIYESTANGLNHWKEMCDRARADIHQCKFTFLGWWSNPTNAIRKHDPRYKEYAYPPDGDEVELISKVRALYNTEISREQLAWIRYEAEHNDSGPGGIFWQNNPWTEHQAFIVSGFSFFPVRLLTAQIEKMDDPKNEESYQYQAFTYDFGERYFDTVCRFLVPGVDSDNDIELKVWEEPHPEGRYVIACDPAWGENEDSDNTVIQVWRCYADRIVQVAEYCANDIVPARATWVLAHLAGVYKDCIVNIEVTGGGGRAMMVEMASVKAQMQSETYASRTQDRGWEDALNGMRWYMYNRVDSIGGTPSAYNFMTDWKTKPMVMDQLKGTLFAKEIDIRSKYLVLEMQIVVRDGSKIGAPSGANSKDDRVMTAAIAVHTWIQYRKPEMLNLGLTYEMVQSMESQTATVQSKSLMGIVARFMASQAAAAKLEEGAIVPTWKTERGLE